MKRKPETLIVIDHGDPSVGIWEQSWEIQCPFFEDEDQESKDWFREQIIGVYKDFCDGKCTAEFVSVLNEIED